MTFITKKKQFLTKETIHKRKVTFITICYQKEKIHNIKKNNSEHKKKQFMIKETLVTKRNHS